MNQVSVCIIATGSELIHGVYPDTNSTYLSRVLSENGFTVKYHACVADNTANLKSILGFAEKECELIIIGGGLGPTRDDVTRQAVADYFGISLFKDDKAESMIRDRFRLYGREMPEKNLIQAHFPEGAIPLYNQNGTAPGFICKGDNSLIIAIPGPPREMIPMFQDQVMPYLLNHFDFIKKTQKYIIRTCGLSESEVAEKLDDLFLHDPNIELTILAGISGVDLRFTLRFPDEVEREEKLAFLKQRVLSQVEAEDIYAFEDIELEVIVARLLSENGLSLAVAESCTGGLVSSKLTDVPGSSDYTFLNVISYSNQAKSDLLGVTKETLNKFGAVSEQCASGMAAGIRELGNASIGLSITGITGPAGGTEEKPVGLVYFGVCFLNKNGEEIIYTRKRNFLGERKHIKERATVYALDFVRRIILSEVL